MSQQSDEYSFLVERLLDILAEQYGFREHWDVDITNNIDTSTVSFLLRLRRTPGRNGYGDMQVGFWMESYTFAAYAFVRERAIEAANNIVGNLRYRNQQDSHPPQVKIYCWLREHNQEMRDQYMVPEHRPEPPFGNSIHLHVLLADLLGSTFGTSISVYPREVRIGRRGDPSEMVFHSPRELSHTVAQLLTQRQLQSTPTVSSQHRSHIRRVEL